MKLNILKPLFFCGAIAPLSHGAVIQFDLGHNTQTTTATGWNNLTGGNGAVPPNITNAVDSTGDATTIDLLYSESNGSDSGIAGTARTPSGALSGAALAIGPSTATEDLVFSRDSPVLLTLADLDTDLTYDIEIFGGSDRAGLSVYTVTGFAGASAITLNTGTNTSDTAVFAGIAPNASGEITIGLISDNTTDPGITRGFAVMNTLVVTSIPEPSAAALGGIALLGILRRRRSC